MGKMISCAILLSIILLIVESMISCLANNVTFDCIPRERKALLRFRASLSDPSNRLSSWKTDDCCTWQGVECDKATGHVTRLDLGNRDIKDGDIIPRPDSMLRSEAIDSSLLELKYLSYLDLSWNDFQYNLIPAFLGSMKQLQHLNLSNANLSGIVPHQLGNLSSLHTLDLKDSYDSGFSYGNLIVDDLMWASNLSSLEYLDMGSVDLGGTKDLVKVLSMLPSIVVLRLSYCELDNTNLPHACLNSSLFTNVQHLDLSHNSFEGELPCFLHNMTSLSYLDLSFNQYNSSDPHSLTSKNLAHLNLDSNSLNHKADWISDLLWDKCHLKSLNLRSNHFYGDISGAFKNLSGCWGRNLENLDLGVNEFDGHLPEELGELKQLSELDVSYNRLPGPIPSSLGNLTALRVLYLDSNQLSGEIPISLGQLSNLEVIDISNNSFKGTLSEAHFAKLSKLESLYVGFSMLKFRVGYDWVPPFQLKSLWMPSNEIKGQFPQWLQTQKALTYLDLSNCSITGTLPKWLHSINLTQLDLSNNHIEGSIPELASSMGELFLSNNMINHLPSNIGHMMPLLGFLYLDGNFINGSIPDSLCQMKYLQILDLSKNHLSGNLPECWGNLELLIVARLSSNQLSGAIPNSIGGAYGMQRMHLNNNSLTGEIPSTLKNCTRLAVLDVGDNKLSGKLPEWIGKYLFGLAALRLRNNNFYGDIPSAYCQLSKLQIMDLADNNLTGNIPQCFGNFSGMVKKETNATMVFADDSYWTTESFSEVMSGELREYEGMTSQYLVHLDLSSNRFVGEIPCELTNLTGLIGLNLSHNHLRGKIPGNIGDMEPLISLDLSCNSLFGTIPESLSKLTFLSHLNLSNNNLSGQIPTGPQLQTFNDPSHYEGNPGLCGAPLLKKCHINETPPKVENDAEDDGDTTDKFYLYAFIISGLATGFWGYFGVLVFKRRWRQALFGYMDAVIGKMLGRY